MTTPKRILVAMSGGVDSSVAAALLHEAGHELIGVTLHLWDAEGFSKVGRCCAPEDRDDARRTCEHLGVPHYVLDEREAFREHVVEPFVAEYLAGRTPIPCVSCNRTVKLTYLADIAERFGASHVATGHYARLERSPRGLRLLRGRDGDKDQSYFLFGLPQSTLERLVFPLGDLTKPAVREVGRRLGVPNADKPDSQELCFVPNGGVGDFIRRERHANKPGSIIDPKGNVLGRHDGVANFTRGQRRGLGLGGGGGTRYVLRIMPKTDDVVVGSEEELYDQRLTAKDAVWVAGRPTDVFQGEVRIRYRHRGAMGEITPTHDGFEVLFAEPQRAITPGQAAVVYRGDEVIGGGFIA
jgi:tRNA-specific 2-thiouridylase